MSKSSFVSSLVSRFPLTVWWLLAIVLVAGSQLAQHFLDRLYVASQFPVSFFEGQTAFDADKVKSWYMVLIEHGTLDRYIWVQIADYGYMATVLAGFFALTAAIYRSLPVGHWLKGAALVMILVACTAPAFDALENLVSFFMLADPVGFADWLVYPYSGFASAKFAVYVMTYLWTPFAVLVAILSGLVGLVRARRHTVL